MIELLWFMSREEGDFYGMREEIYYYDTTPARLSIFNLSNYMMILSIETSILEASFSFASY